MRTEARKQIFKNISYLKWKMRFTNSFVMEQVLNSFARSLILYVGTPMVAAGLWKRRDIENLERQTFKQAAMVPNNINADVIVNLMRDKVAVWRLVERMARRKVLDNDNQRTLGYETG